MLLLYKRRQKIRIVQLSVQTTVVHVVPVYMWERNILYYVAVLVVSTALQWVFFLVE